MGRRLRGRPLHGRRRRASGRRHARCWRPPGCWPPWLPAPAGCASGSLVLGNTYRHPAVLANWAATVDHLSGGRLVLGVGAGWQENEHAQYGIRLPPPGERVSRFEEACQVWTGLLRAGPAPPSTATHYQLTDALCEPKPVQEPLPLLIGGKGDRMLGVVARYADQWNMWGLGPTHRRAVGGAGAAAARPSDRDPAEIHRSRAGPRAPHRRRDHGPDRSSQARRAGRHRRHGRPGGRGGGGLAGGRPRRGHRPRLHPGHRASTASTAWTRIIEQVAPTFR